ncbi:hypothetical protein [Streptomyces sp. RB17]|uniref:hypothetical protein n=1 Tax=Streptomyces sp. RB17 TaxID=2585197 RepID=UPI001297D54B|nr:hypothetical protein [Streptomyces sp. RB17]
MASNRCPEAGWPQKAGGLGSAPGPRHSAGEGECAAGVPWVAHPLYRAEGLQLIVAGLAQLGDAAVGAARRNTGMLITTCGLAAVHPVSAQWLSTH